MFLFLFLDDVNSIDFCLFGFLLLVFVVVWVEFDENDLFGRVEGRSVGELFRNLILFWKRY